MRGDFNPIAVLLLVNFNFIGNERGSYDNFVGVAGPHGNCAVLRVDGNICVRTHRKTVFLLGLGKAAVARHVANTRVTTVVGRKLNG